jgi:transposase
MKIMPKDIKEEKLRWIKPILEKKITIKDMCSACPFSQKTLKYWISSYRKYGDKGLIPKSTRPHTNPNETPIRIKERIIELRKETELCAFKLNILLKEDNIYVSERFINKIIKEEGLTRKYRTRKIKYKYVKALMNIGDLVEIDIKYVPCLVNNTKYYQFTMIDKVSRWRYLKIYDDMSSYSAIEFLKEAALKAPFEIKSVMNHALLTDILDI